jgi:F0F1-type ATP synthase assembly protein I
MGSQQQQQSDTRRRNIAGVTAIVLGLLIGIFIRRVRVGLLIGIVLGLTAAMMIKKK